MKDRLLRYDESPPAPLSVPGFITTLAKLHWKSDSEPIDQYIDGQGSSRIRTVDKLLSIVSAILSQVFQNAVIH